MNLIPMVLISVELTGQVVDLQWLYLVVGSLVLVIIIIIIKMEVVMDRVVDTPLNLYNTICYRVWKLCFVGNRQASLQVSIHVSGWQSGSHTGSRVRYNVVRKIK